MLLITYLTEKKLIKRLKSIFQGRKSLSYHKYRFFFFFSNSKPLRNLSMTLPGRKTILLECMIHCYFPDTLRVILPPESDLDLDLQSQSQVKHNLKNLYPRDLK